MPDRGVRYYRALPPPRDEWDADFAAMADAGLDFVVLPAPWSQGHVYDDSFEFGPLVEQLELAERHGLGVVVAAVLTTAPAWLTARHPEHLHESATGVKAPPRATAEAPCGGWPGLCFDNGTVRSYAGRFLRALAGAAAPHAALAAYDLSDAWALEPLIDSAPRELHCQCQGSRARFIAWLRRAYADDLEALAHTWGRRYRRWAQVGPPAAWARSPDVMDWLRFHADALAAQLRWCVEAIREIDADRPTVGTRRPCLGEAQADDAALAREVSEWGRRVATLLPHEAADRARGIAPRKRLWLAGLPARSLASVQRLEWSLLAAGADAVAYEAWRPAHRGATDSLPALATLDGRASARLEAIRGFQRLLAQHPDLAAARLGPPEVAIVVIPESRVFWAAGRASPGEPGSVYGESLDAAWRVFAGRGARTVFVQPEQLTDQPLAYVPAAFAIGHATAEALRGYVERGGHLVAEACLGRFDEHGRCGRLSPGRGLDELFGARAIDAAERLLDDGQVTFKGRRVSYPCALRREPLEATTGRIKATFADGAAAIVDRAVGAGATRLIGTCPAYGCQRRRDKRHERVILDSLPFARIRPRVTSSSPAVHVALLERDGTHFLVASNPADQRRETTVRVSRALGTFRRAHDLVTGKARRFSDNARRLRLPPSDGLVLRLEPARAPSRWPHRA